MDYGEILLICIPVVLTIIWLVLLWLLISIFTTRCNFTGTDYWLIHICGIIIINSIIGAGISVTRRA